MTGRATEPASGTTPPAAPQPADVAGAAERIGGHVHRTPVLRSRTVDALLGATTFLKCENLQRAGAFKVRGAFNTLLALREASLLGGDGAAGSSGVVAFSSGNHAQAVALAAGTLGMGATIVMPTDAPPAKMAATRGYGARVITYDRYTEDREEVAAGLVARDGLALVPPFDHPHVMAGQGTATLELLEETGELDALFVPVGGGGLASGAALALEHLGHDRTRLYGVEPQAGDDAQRSLRAGRIVRIDVPRTIADGAQTQALGRLPFEVLQRRMTEVLTAGDDLLLAVMSLLATRTKLVVEPTGCLGLAAAWLLREELAGARIGVVLSGGNTSLERLASLDDAWQRLYEP